MLSVPAGYEAAIFGRRRKILPATLIDISDPDMIFAPETASGLSRHADLTQLTDHDIAGSPKYQSLEWHRLLLDVTLPIEPEDGQTGFTGGVLAGADGTFASPPWAQVNFSGADILQAVTVAFSDEEADGIASDFTLEVFAGSAAASWSTTITDNRARTLTVEGFTVYNPTAVRITISRWSLPYRRPRVIELLPGIYEKWGGAEIYSANILRQTAFDCMSVPYSSAELVVSNASRRFDPANKNGLFQSLEARQALPLSLRLRQADGTWLTLPVGVYYRQNDRGWELTNEGLTIKWSLVSIVGLLATRRFIPPATLPTTLSGWLEALCVQLGENFSGHYLVDAALGATVLTCDESDVEDIRCGQLLRYLCMAAGAYFSDDAETGCLRVEQLRSDQGLALRASAMPSRPVQSANNDVASITIRVGDDRLVYGGTDASSDTTLSVSNPFITTAAQAATAARNILQCYGGNTIKAQSRGNPAAELGDIELVELRGGEMAAGRLYKLQLKYQGGALQNCRSEYLQADGYKIYSEVEILAASGSWTVPDGVSEIYAILVGGGSGGTNGGSGGWDADGEPGTGGEGGLIYYATIAVTPGSTLTAQIGAGGAAGASGGVTTFGSLSSAQGTRYAAGWGDAVTGSVYGVPGEDGQARAARVIAGAAGAENSGAGGQGGSGGKRGVYGYKDGERVIKSYPVAGGPGGRGGSGAVILMYDK